MRPAYYNELDPYSAQWLRNLVAAGHIAPGDVDTRDIRDVHPDDLKNYAQCHFFAGIGIWSHALRTSGWPDTRPVWTGSCPCQPFSQAGAGLAFADERHLWPSFHWLIQECAPAIVIGEQVASKDAEPWVDLVQNDLEGLGYAFGCVPFPASGIGAPHIRDRLYWMANAHNARLEGRRGRGRATKRAVGARGVAGGMADTHGAGSLPGALTGIHSGQESAGAWHGESQRPDAVGGMADTHGNGRGTRRAATPAAGQGHPVGPARGHDRHDPASALGDFWRNADWLLCRDGKWRPVEPGTFPLAYGIAGRVGRLRAYGNALCSPQAAAFIAAAMEVLPPWPS